MNVWILSIMSALVTFLIYGGVVNSSSILQLKEGINLSSIMTILLAAAPFDLIHAISTFFFLLILYPIMIKKMIRLKKKYGFMENLDRKSVV